MRRAAKWVLALVIVWGITAWGPAAGASGSSDPVAQEQPAEPPPPSDSDDEVRLVMALLIAVAVVALLGTFVYWVRTGDRRPIRRDQSLDSSGSGDTLG